MELRFDDGGALAPFPLSLRCPICGQNGIFQGIGGFNDVRFAGPQLDAGFRVCPNRSCLAFVYVVHRSGSHDIVFTEPRQVIGFDTTDIPQRITSTLEEAITCHANACYVASAIMVRKTLEELCEEKGAEGATLAQRIADLGSRVILPPELLEGLDELRIFGNDAAHVEARVYDEIGATEVEVVIDFTKEVLKAVYQSGALLARVKALRPSEADS